MRTLRFNPDSPSSIQTVSLGGTSYRVRSTWRERSSSWYIDVYLVDGTSVALGRRVAAGAILVHDMDRHDPASPGGGVLFAGGKDRYAREDLGGEGGIDVHFATREEWDIVSSVDASEAVLIT